LSTRRKKISGIIVPVGLAKLSVPGQIESFSQIYRGRLHPHIRSSPSKPPTREHPTSSPLAQTIRPDAWDTL
jgi:hypothetical protein